MATLTRYTTDDIVERGEEIYQTGIRQQVEPGNIGKLMMIDINTGDWVMGTDRLEMFKRARAKNPDAVLYGLRIGYPATTAIGGNLRSYDEIARDEAEDKA